jgi:hypothetical protein
MTEQQSPRVYGREIVDQILDRAVLGERLTTICADPEMPDLATVRSWLARYPDFRREYDLATECYMDDLLDQCHEIVDDLNLSTAEARLKTEARFLLYDWREAERIKENERIAERK